MMNTSLRNFLPVLILAASSCTPATSPDAGVETPRDAGIGTSDAGNATGPADAGGPTTDAGEPEPDAGPTRPPAPDYPNESCSDAIAVTPGVQISATTANARDDHQGSCDFSTGGADLVYAVTLEEPAGLQIRAEGYDMVMYLTQGGCGASDEVDDGVSDGCVDDISDEENMLFELLPAGTYNIIIDTYVIFEGEDVGGAFTLDVDVFPGGYCFGDAFDPDDNTPENAVYAGTADIDTSDLGDPSTEGPDPVELILCEGDEDWFYVGHMGGEMSLSLTSAMPTGTLAGELYAATLTFDEFGDVALAAGDKLVDVPVDPPAVFARGYYLLKVTGAGQQGVGDSYSFQVSHACQPDFADEASLDFDDNDVSRIGVSLFDRPAAPLERVLCGTDEDTVALDVRFGGDISVILGNGGSLDYDVQEIVSVDGEEALAGYPGVVTPSLSGEDLILSLPAVPAGTRLYVKVSLGDASVVTPWSYTVDARFGDPPSNDACDGVITLDPDPAAPVVLGRTLGAEDHSTSPCGGDVDAAEAGVPGAPDVFYSFATSTPTDTDIIFNGRTDPEHPEWDFVGSVYLYIYPGSCPADFSGLTLFTILDPATDMPEPVCASGDGFRIRIPELPPDNYLLVVDGTYTPATSSSPARDSRGGFELSVQTYPVCDADGMWPACGFPPAAVCLEAEPVGLPAPGQSISVDVDISVGLNELEADDYECLSSGTRGRERALRFVPSQDLVVSIETDGDFDSQIILREGSCTTGQDLLCDDDGGSTGLNSALADVELTAGIEYHLFVEGFSSASNGSTTVTITAAP